MSDAPQLPGPVASVRRDLCAKCPTPCVYQHRAGFYLAPCNACPLPRPRWGRRGRCTQAAPATVPPTAAGQAAEPTVAELAENFGRAVARWHDAGYPVVTAERYAARAAACEACPLWDGAARLGLGRCNAPGCGCTRLKRWLATERCPLGKWSP